MAQQVRSLFDTAAGTAAATAPDPNRGWLILPQQDVAFEVRQGMVHHHGLKMTVKDVVITTEGSVGIETQEINLLASIPVQESWLNNDRKLAFLKGQAIKIPVRGTLSKPQLDGKVIENLGKQLVGSVVQGQIDRQVERGQELLQKQLNSGFNRLFGPQPPQQPQQPAPPSTPPAVP
jgi:translocation and assembly module TamB